MEYERIHKPQTGIISPSKLRMKLIGPHNGKKKDGSNNNSARTSPSRLEDTEFVKNSLLTSNSGALDDEVAASNLEVTSVKLPSQLDTSQSDQTSTQPKQTLPKGKADMVHAQMHQFSKGESGNSSAIHPLRTPEDEILDYDSNASSSSFEFHKERSAHIQFTRSLSRPMSSKWSDAEKWIMSRQSEQQNYSKKNGMHNQVNRAPVTSTVRVIPELANHDPKSSIGRLGDLKRVDVYQPASQMTFEKFSFVPAGTHSVPTQGYGGNVLIDQCTQIKDLKEVDQRDLSCTRSPEEDATVLPVIRSVCMRDMGTEMTPATSLEPSRTATPLGATTPLRSPTSSIPSTPRRGAPAPKPTELGSKDDAWHVTENGRKELTEQELKLKTRREIVALGVQLGKMNIAAWASKDDQDKHTASVETHGIAEFERIEYETRAAVWEEAEKSKHAARFLKSPGLSNLILRSITNLIFFVACMLLYSICPHDETSFQSFRYKREEIKIQAWESRQKAKLEAELRRIEARVEQMRAQAQARMVKKIAMARQKSEEKRAAAEARKNQDAERTAAQAEYIRQTGRMPSSHYLCCGWW